MMKETQNGQIMNGEIIFYVLSGRFGNNGLFATKDCSHMFNLGSFSMLQAKCPANNWSYQILCRSSEYSQTDIGVQRVRDWAASSGSLADEDLFISADVDEILSQSTLQQLQWCQTSAEVISGAIWMPLGNLKNAYRSAFAVAGMPHMFGMPTIYKWGSFMSRNMSGRRLFDRHTKYVTGGIHLTNSAFLPTALLKELTATEGGYYNGFVNLAFLFDMTVKEMEEEQERLYTHHYRSC